VKEDTLIIEILADGTIKTTTDKISGANHANAEQFLRTASQMVGGETRIQRRAVAPKKQETKQTIKQTT
jgi:hypothetical protein